MKFAKLKIVTAAVGMGVSCLIGASKPVAAQEIKPHAELEVKEENGVAVSYLKVVDEALDRQTISIEISGFPSDKGKCAVMLASDKTKYYSIDPRKPRDGWLDAAATATDAPIKEGKATFVVHDVPDGEYVVAAFHDKNVNQLLDSNRLGMPKEAYGFSQGMRWKLRIPKWDKAKINVHAGSTTFMVKVR